MTLRKQHSDINKHAEGSTSLASKEKQRSIIVVEKSLQDKHFDNCANVVEEKIKSEQTVEGIAASMSYDNPEITEVSTTTIKAIIFVQRLKEKI